MMMISSETMQRIEGDFNARLAAVTADRDALKAELDRLEVSLAGISTAAMGTDMKKIKECIDKKQWAFTLPLKDVYELRVKYDALLGRVGDAPEPVPSRITRLKSFLRMLGGK